MFSRIPTAFLLILRYNVSLSFNHCKYRKEKLKVVYAALCHLANFKSANPPCINPVHCILDYSETNLSDYKFRYMYCCIGVTSAQLQK